VSSIENKQASTWFSSDNRRLIVQEYGIFLAFLLLAFILSLSNEYFLTPGNISNVLLQTSINGVLAIGMTFVILTGGSTFQSVRSSLSPVSSVPVSQRHRRPRALLVAPTLSMLR
jgi:ribose/xylose/arabinose/galactoside ABC-type transport system permease subunit